eukprot:TRINITY_DN13779_c0_g1_i1.p1 TRINITY_DN13779_c0_g1~~TRINITY_DN13779_c0_g1_i1.p1  ORF type:complete len:806 (-),score=140.92 TRINITY_DN13779_c0_g1_i1:418-2835(-)
MPSPGSPEEGQGDVPMAQADALPSCTFQILLQQLASAYECQVRENRLLKQEKDELNVRLSDVKLRTPTIATDSTAELASVQDTSVDELRGSTANCSGMPQARDAHIDFYATQMNNAPEHSSLANQWFSGPCAYSDLLKSGLEDRMDDFAMSALPEDIAFPPDHFGSDEVERPPRCSVRSVQSATSEKITAWVFDNDSGNNTLLDAEGGATEEEHSVNFDLMPAWKKEVDADMAVAANRSHMSMSLEDEVELMVDGARGRKSEIRHAHSAEPDPSISPAWLQRCMAYPQSPQRVAWDMLGGTLVVYDVFFLPLSAFVIVEHPIAHAITYLALAYWTSNIFASLTVGYVKDGITITSPELVVMHYLKTWCIIDILVVVPDWMDVFVSGSSTTDTEQKNMKLLNVVRFLRLAKLVRLARLKKVIDGAMDMVDSEATTIMLRIVKMLALMVMITHFITCLNFAVSKSSNKNNWIQHYGIDDWDWEDAYGIAFHWTLTQFTPSSKPPLQPQNRQERAFSICVVMFALVGFSYVVGSITQSLTQLRSMNEGRTVQLWTLRRYLRHNRVSMTLTGRIHKYIEHKMLQRQDFSVMSGAGNLLPKLSTQLRGELQCEITVPHLQVHPLMARLSECNMSTMRRLAFEAITPHSLAEDDLAFTPGEQAMHFSVVVLGKLIYSRIVNGIKKREWVDLREDWIAEPALWCTQWHHLGELKAHMPSELLQISPAKFAHIVSMNVASFICALTFSQNYVLWLNTQSYWDLSDITQGEEMTSQLELMLPMSIDVTPTKKDVISKGGPNRLTKNLVKLFKTA